MRNTISGIHPNTHQLEVLVGVVHRDVEQVLIVCHLSLPQYR